MSKFKNYNNPIKHLAQEAVMQPQEMAAPIGLKKNSLWIGIPKEITYQENRTPLTPSAVNFLVNQGHRIRIETGAGEASHFPDIDFSEAGAEIVSSKKEVYESHIILKIDPPTPDEVDLMKPGQILFSALQLKSLCKITLGKMLHKKIHALAYEFIEDESGSNPIVRAMSEIAGHASILVGAEFLNNSHIGKGELLGGFTGIPPTQVVIIGAGAVGEYATRAALGLGAGVKVFDDDLYRLRRLQDNIGNNVFTSTLNPKILSESLRTADLAIGALRPKLGRTPEVVSEAMVAQMKPKSVIIDVAIDHGGVFATSDLTNHENPVFRKYDVIHYCVPNITSRISRTASYALSNIFTPLITDLAVFQSFDDFIKFKKGARHGVYIYGGNLCHQVLGRKFQLRYKNLDLLLGNFVE